MTEAERMVLVKAADLALVLSEVIADGKYGADVDFPVNRLRVALHAGSAGGYRPDRLAWRPRQAAEPRP